MLQVERFFQQSRTLLRHCCWCEQRLNGHRYSKKGTPQICTSYRDAKYTDQRVCICRSVCPLEKHCVIFCSC